MPNPPVKIYFDGGCRPNPGTMEIAIVMRGIVHHIDDIGTGTNSDAEWLALIHALRFAYAAEVEDFVLLGDSAVIIGQARGEAKCRGADLRRHLDAFHALAAGRPRVRIRQIGRAQNLAGIALAGRHGR